HAGVVAWRDGDDPYDLVRLELDGMTEVGVEKDHLSLHAAEVITSRTGVSELLDVGPEILRLRVTKQENEVEKLVRAAAITDATRMGVVGKPGDRQREIHDVVLKAHDAAIAAVSAGVTTGEVDAAARRVIDAAGYGERFFHRVGHGLGLEAHEAPSLDPGSLMALEPGMGFTVEPGVYIPGFGGVRIEDDVLVEEGGCRVLTRAD